MKKKLLALAIVLVMIISMLPVTAFAETEEVVEAAANMKVRVYDPNNAWVSGTKTYYYLESVFNNSTPAYYVFEDVLNAETQEVIGNKPVKATETPEDNYIKFQYVDGVFTITLKNVNYKRSETNTNPFIIAYENKDGSVFDVVVQVEGTNKIEGSNASFEFGNTGSITIQGDGSLDMTVPQTYKKGVVWGYRNTSLAIKNTTFTALVNSGSSERFGIISKGSILIENSTVDIRSNYGRALTTRSGSTANPTSCTVNDAGITIKDSNVTMLATSTNGKGTGVDKMQTAVETKGDFIINNSTVLIGNSSTSTGDNSYSAFLKAPIIIGTYSEKLASSSPYSSKVVYSDYDSFGLTAGDPLKRGASEATTLIKVIKFTVQGCTHENAAQQEFCDVAVVCPDCGQEAYPAKEHTAADDGNCLTADLCTVCGKEAVAAAEAHVPVKELDNCLSGVKCANCDQYAIEPVGKHTGTQPDRPCGTHHKCEICGQSWGAKKAHDEKKVAAQEATCGVAGHTDYWTCNNCDKVFAAADCSVEIEDLATWLAEGGDGYIAPTGEHTEGEPAVDPETGDTVISCTVCNKELSRVPAETPCDHANAPAQEFCDVAVNCPDCGEEVYAAKSHTEGPAADCENDQICTVCEKVLVEKLGHTPGAAADCENDQVCTVCGDKLADKLGHTPGAAADCENDQVCTVCGDKLADKLGHTPGAAADCENDQVCTVCGEKLADKLGHTPGAAADCENDQICTVCKEVLDTAKGHTPGAAADCVNDQICTVCKKVLDTAKGHTPGAEADCLNAQICTVCEKELAPAKGHTYGSLQVFSFCEEEGYIIIGCNKCGGEWDSRTDKEAQDYLASSVGQFINIKPQGHKPGAEADCLNAQICTVCEKELAPAKGHRWGGLVVTPATCTEDGDITITCGNCGKVCTKADPEGQDYLASPVGQFINIKAKGHKYETDVTDATCTENGKTVYTCACGDTYEEPIVSEGHNYIKGETFAPTHTVKGYTVYTCDKCGDSYQGDFVNKLSTAAKNETTGKLYSSLQEAIDEAADGETVALTKSVKNVATLIVPANKKITINFNGKYYAVNQITGKAALIISEGAEVTLTGGGKIEAQSISGNKDAFDCVIENNGKLKLENVLVYASSLYATDYAVVNNGELVLAENAMISVIKAQILQNSGAVTNKSEIAIEAPEGYHWSAEGVLETHKFDKVTSVPATCEKVSYDLHECTCGASYEDNYGTKKLSIVAKIGDQYYASMAEAIAAAKENDVIVLYKNVKNAETIIVTSGKKITIDLNGKYYAVNQITGKAALIVEEGAELILTGGGKIEAQSVSGNKDAFDCVIENNGKLKLENVLVYASSLYASDFAIINNGELTKTADTVISLIKASEMSGNGTVIG